MLATVSCDKQDVEPTHPVLQSISISATISNGENDFNIEWDMNDAIAVINKGKLYRFVASGKDSDGKVSEFKMDLTSLPKNYLEGDFDTTSVIKAFYPYEGVTYDTVSRTFNYSVPDEQRYIANNVEKSLMPLVAYTQNCKEKFQFKKLFGILKLSVIGVQDEKVKKIEILSGNKINGLANVSIEGREKDEEPYILVNMLRNYDAEENSEPVDNNRIVLDITNEVNIAGVSQDFMITLPTSAKDLGILIYTNVTSYYKTISSYNTEGEYASIIKAGKIYSLPEIKSAEMAPAYIENGLYLGDGIALPKSPDGSEKIIWAPVNCGFESDTRNGGQISYRGYLFGKIYQWGRIDGLGYKDIVYEDATYPMAASELNGGKPDPTKFYRDWKTNEKVWPEDSNPCPIGWRVPTLDELLSLASGLTQNKYVDGLEDLWVTSNNDATNKHYGLPGFLFYGNTTNKGECVFFPASGIYKENLTETHIRGLSGCYWSSTTNGDGTAWYLDFNRKGYIDNYYDPQSFGRAIRCVKSQ